MITPQPQNYVVENVNTVKKQLNFEIKNKYIKYHLKNYVMLAEPLASVKFSLLLNITKYTCPKTSPTVPQICTMFISLYVKYI